MKKTRLALAAMCAMGAMADLAVASQRSGSATAFPDAPGADAALLATNSTYTLTPTAGLISDGVVQAGQRAVGRVVFDATAIVAADSVSFTLGFTPRRVVWMNETDRISGEWVEGMAANGCIKTAANGTRTLEVTGGNGGITVSGNGFSVLQNATLALILASKSCWFIAEG